MKLGQATNTTNLGRIRTGTCSVVARTLAHELRAASQEQFLPERREDSDWTQNILEEILSHPSTPHKILFEPQYYALLHNRYWNQGKERGTGLLLCEGA